MRSHGRRVLLGLVGVVWAQAWVADPYLPELPPFELRELSGHWQVQVESGGAYRDSSGDFLAWVSRLPWEEGQEWYPASPASLSPPLWYQKQPRQYLRLYRWQLHRSGRLLRFWQESPPYTLQPQASSDQRLHQASWANQSVLASGRWYKVATRAAGIYRITAQTLQSLGLDPGQVDPRSLRVYGQRGGPLPQANSNPQPDDLVEVPLYFPGEADGRWDPGDAAYFWADSPDAWYLLPSPERPYFHLKNPYTDQMSYFLTFDLGPGKRLPTQAPPAGSLLPRSQGMLLYFYENDTINLLKSGRVWLGEKMTSPNPTVSLTLPIPACDSARVRVQVAASSLNPSQITLSWAGTVTVSLAIPAIPGPADHLQAQWKFWSQLLRNTPIHPTLTLSYTGTGTGYLDHIEVIGWHPLAWDGGQQVFYLPPGGPWQAQLQATGSPFVWDVTDPLNYKAVPLTPTPGGVSFPSAGDTLRRYCAFDLASTYEVTPLGFVPNQNLHSLRGIRFVVATTSALEAAAQRFCDLHPEAGPCIVVTTEKLYNEFSGGRPDLSALRNFLRMLYVRATTPAEMPQMLLIVGAASYDFRKTSDFLFPTYQSRESVFPPASFGSDDFFGFLDDNEGFWGEGAAFPRDPRWYDPRDQTQQDHLLDLSIARIPAYSASDLEAYLEKLTDYLQNPAAKGPWLQKMILFSDYKDNGLHTQQAEALATQIQASLPYLDLVKLYIDRYPAQPRASGLVFPEAQKALLAQLDQGAFIAHYVGHGNEYALQGFEFFPTTTVRQLQNTGRYLFFVTATCEWGKWDQAPEVRSGGVEALFLQRRGAIGLLTSTRKVYASLNFQLTQIFYQALSQAWQAGRRVLLGQVMQATKNRTTGGALGINSRSYSFLGDPFLPLGLPAYDVVVTEIDNSPPSATTPDTLRPLRAVRVRGEVREAGGALQTGFSGEVSIKVWDKSLNRLTLISRTPFTAQDILLFSGSASVQNGQFELTFYLPVDIIPEPGRGRFSLWAQASTGQAAAGSETRFVICCPDTVPPLLPPPTLRLFLNDTTWAHGGWTGPDPLLLAFLQDSLGINLSPLAVGRELKATLNGQEYFLGPYYRARRDQPNQGTLEYRFSNLPEGEYHLRLRAFNLAGQEGSAETSFFVVEKGQLKLGRVFNYPNPFTTATRFCFQHNQPGQPLEARVQIYTVTGRLVATLSAPIPAQSTFSQDLFWDGLDSYGDRLGRGVYLYRLEVRNLATGETAHAQEKLVILR